MKMIISQQKMMMFQIHSDAEYKNALAVKSKGILKYIKEENHAERRF